MSLYSRVFVEGDDEPLSPRQRRLKYSNPSPVNPKTGSAFRRVGDVSSYGLRGPAGPSSRELLMRRRMRPDPSRAKRDAEAMKAKYAKYFRKTR